GGLIGLLQDGDHIRIDSVENKIEALLSEEEINQRKAQWTPRSLPVQSGYLAKYAKMVASASQGCVTDM
ncbi:MAG TPA: dihydroxy-acid dehydratase, partial [Saprospiraceae bacterium]|nr:dihydroxy-acid dehydratase [Saprospiraceae bacterium]